MHASPEAAVRSLADYLVGQARQAVQQRGRFVWALAGGSSPRRLYELLASAEFRNRIDWAAGYFFFGDERYVPHTSPDSNYRLARTTLLEPLGIAADHVFPVDTALPPAAAAQAYTEALQAFFGPPPMQFDLVLLGLGDNAHTASLFPHTPVLNEQVAGAREVYLPEQQVYRITLTAPLINQANQVAFLVYGAEKAAAVRQVLRGENDPAQYPAQLVAPAQPAEWFLDQAAAAELATS
ncbi:6-phosphogluconolactonase [Hymenobacter sp. 15J16-1T3B]|uniref:6-phosphogluconolactonase n=1 Tax=Hymenobacter sp. 15J16-1T3B TaxID=2886941 RepID=UPI001D122E7E|nr:6-phosphogluconolactonase [Hymenobacter sp. 15J16-1T3B]MCC3158686.1 6-phosphogluconolactonase [Hymenobacter sp. 15J16-1T3B]